jgi:N-acetylmuramoyl-L-alanine amidase
MSNPDEAAMLFRPEVQDRIVDALYDAILYYDQVRAAAE